MREREHKANLENKKAKTMTTLQILTKYTLSGSQASTLANLRRRISRLHGLGGDADRVVRITNWMGAAQYSFDVCAITGADVRKSRASRASRTADWIGDSEMGCREYVYDGDVDDASRRVDAELISLQRQVAIAKDAASCESKAAELNRYNRGKVRPGGY